MIKFKGTLADSSLASRLFLLVGTSLFLAFFVVMLWMAVSPGSTTDIQSMRWLQLLETTATFILPPFLLAYFWESKPFAFLRLDKKSSKGVYAGIILLMLALIPFINLLGELNQQVVLPSSLSGLEQVFKNMEDQAAKLTEQLLNVHHFSGLVFNLIVISLVPGFGEELFFRGTFQGILRKRIGNTTAIWITAFVFSAIHFQFYGFIPRMLIGAFFGYLLVWSGNLWLPVLAHIVNNGVAVVFYYLKYNGVKTFDIDTIGTGNTFWLGILSGVVGVAVILFIREKLSGQSVVEKSS
ncbi:MAG TPA: CPBP family intramembrane glutamic endopeptidase [Paludibacter sp.]|nr:CPBP family intramembrane glutamic endopeptidase [Paludibacter sp.]